MAPAAEKRYRVVEVLSNNRHRTIDSDLSLGTARSSIALFKQLDPNRKIVIEAEEPVQNDEAMGVHVATVR